MEKEDIGAVAKKAAKFIPEIGSYQDRISLKEADRRLREKMGRKLDELIGVVEWVKTDQTKKGGWKRIKDLEDLQTDLEKASRIIESADRVYGAVFDGPSVDEELLEKVYELDKGIWDLVNAVEEGIRRLTQKGVVPEKSQIEAIMAQLQNLAHKMAERDALVKGLDVG